MFELLNQIGIECDKFDNCNGCPLKLKVDSEISFICKGVEVTTHCGLIAIMYLDSPAALDIITEDNVNELVYDLNQVVTRADYEEVRKKYGYKR